MDYSLIRYSEPREQALQLRAAGVQLSNDVVTKNLLEAIESDNLPPAIFHLWCTASGDPAVVNHGLRSTPSRLVCRAAIQQFGKLFGRSRPKEIWDAIGGIAGVLNFLANASVHDVRLFCWKLGHTGAKVVGCEQRQQLADELVKHLFPERFPGFAFKASDPRALERYYRAILPACSANVIKSVSPNDDFLYVALSARREQCLRTLEHGGSFSNGPGNPKPLMEDNGSEPRPPQTERMSSNMLFAMNVLETISWQDEIHGLDHQFLQDGLIIPLFKRFVHWKTSPHNVANATHAFVRYRQKYGYQSVKSPDLSEKGIVGCVIRRWTRHPDKLERPLQEMLRLVPVLSGGFSFAGDIVNVFTHCPRSLRFRLLRLLLCSIKVYSADITSDDDLRKLEFRWSPQLFEALPRGVGKRLLQRVLSTKPSDYWTYWATYAANRLRIVHRGDPTCLLLLLSNEDPKSLSEASEAVEIRKSKAVKARAQPDRAFWAQSAIECSIASGSLDMYRDTLLWATRFLKDPLTIKELFSQQTLHIPEAIEILCGFPNSHRSRFPPVGTVRQNILTGNQLCCELVRLACEALKEPGFHQPHWQPVLTLFQRIGSARTSHIALLQKAHGLSDDEAYDIVFKDTLNVALELEELGLNEVNARLGFNTPKGPLGTSLSEFTTTTLKFADDLAKRRDALWETYRRRGHPATVQIHEPYPTGLPLHCLYSSGQESNPTSFIPLFIQTRAKDIVFADPHVVLTPLPAAKEVKDAIGGFIEHYLHAMEIFVSLSQDPHRSALEAWKHATVVLSESRMSPMESLVFWSGQFNECLGKYELQGPWNEWNLTKMPEPTVPSTEDRDTVEWNPVDGAEMYEIESRRLEPTNLDAMLSSRWPVQSDSLTDWGKIESHVPERRRTMLWSSYNPLIRTTTREALICAALAYFCEHIDGAASIMSKPFAPLTSGGVRFPGLYLDDEFLKQHEGTEYAALETLRAYIDYVPAVLLCSIVTVAFKHCTQMTVDPQPIAFELLKLVVEGDRPQLSLGLLQHLILDRPSDSSWQRKLLNQGTMKALPADTTRTFVDNVVDGIQTRLTNAKEAADVTSGGDGASRKPFIKVTTVKMLAQLLAGAEFIDEESTLEILGRLLKTATHHDIRIAIVQALLQLLSGTQKAVVTKTILNGLEKHTIPIMSNVNERHPVSESEWTKYGDDTMGVPEVLMDRDTLPPMLSVVLTFAETSTLDEKVRKALFDRILIPTLHASIKAHKRWMDCFYRYVNMKPVSLPESPMHPLLLSGLLRCVEFVPDLVLDLWLGIFVFMESPTPEVKALKDKIEEDKTLRESHIGTYWLSFWNAAASIFHRSRPSLLLTQDFNSKVPNGIDHRKLQTAVHMQHCAMLQKTDIHLNRRYSVLRDLSPPNFNSAEKLKHWKRHCRPVVQALFRRIESIRTLEWQRDPNRVPNILPDTFTLQMWLAFHPETSKKSEANQIVTTITSLIEELITLKGPYTERHTRLYNFVRDLGLPESDFTAVILGLGSLSDLGDGELETAAYLRVDLASKLLQLVKSEDFLRQIAALVKDWSLHNDEEIRMTGLTCVESMKSKSGGLSVTLFD